MHACMQGKECHDCVYSCMMQITQVIDFPLQLQVTHVFLFAMIDAINYISSFFSELDRALEIKEQDRDVVRQHERK